MGAMGITSATIAGHIMNNPPSNYTDAELLLAHKLQYICITLDNIKAYITEIKGESVHLNYNIIRNPNITHNGHQFKFRIESIPDIDTLRLTKLGQILCL